jgi:hypothetical protein
MASFEPGADWFSHILADNFVEGPRLTPPRHHPLDQPVPGPADVVPSDWVRRLPEGVTG